MKTFCSLFVLTSLLGFATQLDATASPLQSRKGVVILPPDIKFRKLQTTDSLFVKISGDRLTRKQAQQLTAELQKQKGVIKAQVNFELNTAQITFEANAVNSNRFSEIINSFKSPQGQSKYRAIIMYDSSH